MISEKIMEVLVVYFVRVRSARLFHLISNWQFVQYMIYGIQKWRGAPPSLRTREVTVIGWAASVRNWLRSDKIMAIRRIIEASVCARKYFNADSVSRSL